MVKSPSISHFFVTALQQRCSVVTNPENGETVIIDGGGDSNSAFFGSPNSSNFNVFC